ncbi:metal dependent phosphohydrolase [Desulforamulus reducens MI-1]|uniref:Metal dependent phosphohydrolase n=1 Tax=Desulforamulus reducens (strain ATCC BAA-1160 / DSM 100696 / MI-1) TaxID=349161 RepID=A4J5S9_DESRM|nr:HDIG domain-containing metalloprotein [Desulforamulus reducens]ABO50432.1 metal dependent phosphohydrolase [Desulforamulus reducens MI-1]
MLTRIRQFWFAIFSKMGSEDIQFVQSHLTLEEQSLFFQMDRPTQTHCLRVANTCLKLLGYNSGLDQKILIKAALLHDIGKPANLITTIDRVLIVLLGALTRKPIEDLLKVLKGRGRFSKVLSAHAMHPQKGAVMARNFGLPQEIINLIEKHHQPIQSADPSELAILKKADELN